MAVDIQTIPAPVSLPDAKPSDLIESLPEDRWLQGQLRFMNGLVTRYCSVGILLEHAGYEWQVPYFRLLQETYGISSALAGAIVRINDTQGKAAVVTYLRERGL